MKKTSKIIALISVIFVLCTAFAVSSFAATSGITVKKTGDMQNATGGGVGKGLSGTGYSWTMTYTSGTTTLPRRGTTSVAESADGNKYAVFTQTGGNDNAGYVGTGYGAVGTTFAGSRANVDADGNYTKLDTNNEYLVFDIDFMSPTGNFSPININLELRYAKPGSTKTADVVYVSGQQAIFFEGNTIKKNGVTGAAYELNPYEFTHVTVIYDKVVKDGYITVDSYVYINGEFFGYTAGNDPTGGKGASFFAGSVPHLVWEEIRVNFPKGEDATKSLAMDNMITRLISDDYDGNLATVLASKDSLDAWESSVYDKNSMPTGISVAKIGDVEYDSLEKAVAAAEDGSSITLLKDCAKSVTVSKLININAGQYSANIVAGEGFVVDSSVSGVYSIKESPNVIEYVNSNGNTVYIKDGAGTLADAFSLAKAGTTVKLLGNTSISSQINVTKNLTLDLNGKTLDLCTAGTKFDGFSVKANVNFTVKSSEVGAKVFSAAVAGGGPVISTGGNNCVININGRDDNGNSTLSVFAATVVQSWSRACSVYVDGGEYYRSVSDNLGQFQFQDLIDCKIENALIYDPVGTVFLVNGRYAKENGTKSATMLVDNCVIISGGNVASYTYSTLDFRFTNCYISGNILPDNVYTGQTAGKITLGMGNRINGNISDKVVLDDGLAMNRFPESVDVAYKYNKFSITADGIDPSSYTVTEEALSLDFDVCTSKKGATAATVIWTSANGEILGFSTAMPGTKARAPKDLSAVTLVENWLKIVPTEWENSLTVPEDATVYTVKAKADGKGEILPAVDLRLGINLLTHLQYNLYIPVAMEGIEVTNVVLRSDRTANYNSLLSNVFEIDGKLYNTTTSWPGLRASLDDASISVSFTYEGKCYTAATTISMVDYCSYVLENSEYSDEQKDMAANVANYIYTGNVFLANTSSAVDEMLDIVSNNTSRIITPDESELVKPDTSDISKYVSSVQLVLVDYGPKFRFNLTTAGKEATLIGLSTGYQDNCDTKAEYSALGYVETRNTDIRQINSTTVTVEGAGVSLTYTLANYIAALSGQDSAMDAFLVAMYGYAASAEKLSEIKN